MLRNPIVLVPAVLLIAGSMLGQTGSTGMSFLKLGIGGRALGMGEAYSALASDPSAMYYNPAALQRASGSKILLMHKEWIQGTKTEFLGASTSCHELSFGLAVNATSIDDIELRTVPGPPIGVFTARNASIGLSAAYSLDSNLAIGVTGKFLYEKILVDAASGIAFDLGGIYTTPWDIRIALAVSNLGSMNVLNQEATQLPTTVRVGGAYGIPFESLEGALTLTTDIVSLPNENKTHLHFGSEFDYHHLFMIRAGYQTDYESKGFSAGAGVRHGSISIDYAFVPFTFDLGSTHTFSLGIDFP